MASTELLASKVVILEEEPAVPAVAALPSAVLLAVGVAERGPIADPQLLTSFDDYAEVFGGFTEDAELAIAAHGFFYNGGGFLWASRTCHFTDLTDPASYTATKGSVTLRNAGSAASPAVVGPGLDAAPYDLEPGQHVDIDIGAGPVVCTFNAAAASRDDTTVYPVLVGAGTLKVRVNRGVVQVITFAGTETTAADIAATINAQVVGARASVVGGQVRIETDRRGTGAYVQVTELPAANPALVFALTEVQGTGNVADIDAVLQSEAEAVIEAALAAAVAVTFDGTNHMIVSTVATGATAEIQVDAGSTCDFGLDHDPHAGADATPQDTLTLEGKTPGAYTGTVTIRIEGATSGAAASFNLKVLRAGLVKETFPNLTMDATSADYVETRVNHATQGSALVRAIDLALPLTPAQKRPVNGTSAALAGGGDGLVGITDADYLGNQAGPTGLFTFDVISTGTILIVPGVSSAAVHKGMMDYAEVTRNGRMFCVLDCPPQLKATEIVTFVESNGLLEYSEFGVIYWPWIQVVNPAPSVFGSAASIAVAPSGWIAGKYASNDQKIGGIYESPAGIGGGFGVIRGMVGVEADPSGRTIHEVEDERKRDLIYPMRINPITRLPGQPWHIDGGRTLKSTGNFPNVGERRGVIFIETSLRDAVQVMRHRYNNRQNRKVVDRMFTAFLKREMKKGAFRSEDPATAFFVDVSDKLNPTSAEFAGIMTIRVGLATNKPNEYTVIMVTQDTRALEAELAA